MNLLSLGGNLNGVVDPRSFRVLTAWFVNLALNQFCPLCVNKGPGFRDRFGDRLVDGVHDAPPDFLHAFLHGCLDFLAALGSHVASLKEWTVLQLSFIKSGLVDLIAVRLDHRLHGIIVKVRDLSLDFVEIRKLVGSVGNSLFHETIRLGGCLLNSKGAPGE